MPARLSTALSILALLVGACDPSTPEEDAGISVDAGLEAGVDAGALVDDAGADAGARDAGDPGVDAGPPRALSVLVFTKTAGFRHASIADGVTALTELAAERGWTLDTTEDAARFSADGLAGVDVLVFLNPTGTFMDDDAQRSALEAWVRGGGGWVGVHAAADAEYDWPFYGELVGAWFERHPRIQEATLVVEDRAHPATRHLDATWVRTDEWYDFRTNPRPDVDVLITIDESTYDGHAGGGDHPMTWAHDVDAGRSFYTALGHTRESYAEPAFRQLLAEAINWAAGGG